MSWKEAGNECVQVVCLQGDERGVFSKWGGCSLRSVARWGLAVKYLFTEW